LRLESAARFASGRPARISFRRIISAGFSAILSAFALGRSHRVKPVLEGALPSARNASAPSLLSPALCGIAALAVFLLLVALQRWIGGLLKLGSMPQAAAAPVEPAEKPAGPTAGQMLAEGHAAARDIGADSPVQTPEPRNPNIAEGKALHAAALMAIGSRSLRSPELRQRFRRSSDYEGPRRRATDNRPPLVYEGPFRRTSDIASDQAGTSPVEERSEPVAAVPDGGEISAVSGFAEPAAGSGAEAGGRSRARD